ncbi:alcohol dehydrogenase catalytic domain-containing protein [soil metagenome]|jgi:threonine dehydrogenase-like Zn-dependent dehydrogenase|nr:alcohol dehydrogenase catalytic domain-containing protein [Acidobacteriota bacterium]
MQALRFTNKKLKLAEILKPNDKNEALVRVVKSGICRTDLEIVKGYANFAGTIGHEFVGVIEEAKDAPNLVGKRVVGEINVGCGICDLCQSGDARHCPQRTVLGIVGRDGAHAEFLTLPTRNLLEVPAEITNEQAVFTEPLAAAYAITEQVSIKPDTKAAVIGDGKLGILCAQSLALKSRNVVLIGKHKEKLSIIEKRNIEGVLLKHAPKLNRQFDIAVEASGSESGFNFALDLLKPRGKLILKSTFHGEAKWQAWRVVVDEITIVGSRCGRFVPALELLKNKAVDVESLISTEFPLRDGVKAMEQATKKGVMKVLLSITD